MKDELIAYVCPKCGRHLVDAPRGARVSCPHCGVWTREDTPDRQRAPTRNRA